MPPTRRDINTAPVIWWEPRKRGAYNEGVFTTVRTLEDQHEGRLREYADFARHYGHGLVSQLTPHGYKNHDATPSRRLRYNIIRSVTDTVVALIARDQPQVKILVDDGRALLQQHAKKLTKFLYGIFEQNKVYQEAPKVFRDAALVGTGAFKFGMTGEGNICIERVWVGELFYDYVDAFRGQPRSMHHRWNISRHVAAAMFPEHRKDIMLAPAYTPKSERTRAPWESLTDEIEIIESWHLPSGNGADDGVHTISIENKTLVAEVWEYDFFPFAFVHWGDPIYGLDGDGLGALLAGHHIALNTHLDNMEKSLSMVAIPKVIVDEASGISIDTIDDRIGAIIKGNFTAGSPPQFFTPPALSPDWVQHTNFIIQSAFQVAGVSMMSATGTKPEGLNSGKAIREAQDVETVRFATVQKNYEKMFLDLGMKVLKMAHKEWDNEIPMKVKGRSFLETIKFGEIDLTESDYELSVFPSSLLPRTPAGRLAQLDELSQAGWISQEEAMQLAQIPDLDKASSVASAAIDDIDLTIEAMVFDAAVDLPEELKRAIKGVDPEEKEAIIADFMYLPPEPAQNLALGIRRCSAAYLRYRHTDVPQPRLDLLLRWVADAQELMAPPQPIVPEAVAGPQPVAQGGANPLPEGVLPQEDVAPGGVPVL